MSGRGSKVAASVVFVAFAAFELLVLMYGEAIMFGHRVYLNVLGPFVLGVLAVSVASTCLIWMNRDVGYLLLGLVITVTLVVELGHRMMWWPCDYCSL